MLMTIVNTCGMMWAESRIGHTNRRHEMAQGDKVYRNGVELGTVNWVSGGVVSVRVSATVAYMWFEERFARRADGSWDWLGV